MNHWQAKIITQSVSLEGKEWTLYYGDHFKKTFHEEEDNHLKLTWIKTLQEELTLASCRKKVIYEGVDLLLTLFFQEKTIYITTPKASYELYIWEKEKALQTQNVTWEKFIEKIISFPIKKNIPVIERITEKYNLPPFYCIQDYSDLFSKTFSLIKDLSSQIKKYRPSLFERVSNIGLQVIIHYPLVRKHFLKFLVLLPSLDFDKKGYSVKKYFLETLERIIEENDRILISGHEVETVNGSLKAEKRKLSSLLYNGIRAIFYLSERIPARLLALTVRKGVSFMAKRFIAGTHIFSSKEVIHSLEQTKRDVTIDQLGELVVSESEADQYLENVLGIIRGLSNIYPKGKRNSAGIFKAHVSIKLSALTAKFRPEDPESTYKFVAPRLKVILLEAQKYSVFIQVDAEYYSYRDLTFFIYKKVLLETPELKNYDQTGIVIQAYLRDAYPHLLEIIELAKERQQVMPIRLVKGAYWDAETIEAKAHEHDAPQFLNKEETDIHFRQLVATILESQDHLQLCIGSHNIYDHVFAETYRKEYHSGSPVIEHQCLHMTYEGLSYSMAMRNWAVRNYLPLGNLLMGMSYLVRRIMENSSQVGVLKQMFELSTPSIDTSFQSYEQLKEQGKIVFDPSETVLDAGFFNVAPVRSYLKAERNALVETYQKFKKNNLGKKYPNVFSLSGEDISIVNPSRPYECVGKMTFASVQDVHEMVQKSFSHFKRGDWSQKNHIERGIILKRCAENMRLQRNSLASLITLEAGKTFNESLADVDEAIDFINYYISQEEELIQSENHDVSFKPRGVMAVIGPWNFPLAIPCGMAVGNLVAGNHVILKSAEQTPLIAQVLVNLLHEAGVPSEALIHLPGRGETVGDALVKQEEIAGVVFTGSRGVGQSIYKQVASKVNKDEYSANTSLRPKKVITEMGGKNAIIVTETADIDEAVSQVLYSAFGHSGQKCSAASRLLVDEKILKKFSTRFVEATKNLILGAADSFSTDINPLISKEDQERVRSQVQIAIKEIRLHGGKILLDYSNQMLSGSDSYHVGPVILQLPIEKAMQSTGMIHYEFFAPVVHIVPFKSLDEAIKLFNNTHYALTGGIFSESEKETDKIIKECEAGNLYINRHCTGARVSIEPFGGFKCSGTGPKAGGKNYLKVFHVIEKKRKKEQGVLNFNVKGSYISHISFNTLELTEKISILQSGLTELMRDPFISNWDLRLMREFMEWLKNDAVHFSCQKETTRSIPGQLSFNDYSLVRRKGALISLGGTPSTLTYLFYLMGNVLGSDLMLWTGDHRGLSQSWSYLLSPFYYKFPRVSYIKESLESFLEDSFEYLFMDGKIKDMEHVLQLGIDKTKDTDWPRIIYTEDDFIEPINFNEMASTFFYERTFAINTIRHGAPLEQ